MARCICSSLDGTPPRLELGSAEAACGAGAARNGRRTQRCGPDKRHDEAEERSIGSVKEQLMEKARRSRPRRRRTIRSVAVESSARQRCCTVHAAASSHNHVILSHPPRDGACAGLRRILEPHPTAPCSAPGFFLPCSTGPLHLSN